MVFIDRLEAGRRLASALRRYHRDHEENVVVLGVARGGMVTAAEVAKQLDAPLDVVVVRKIGHPFNLRYAVGAVGEDGDIVLDMPCRSDYDIGWLRRRIDIERAEARRQREIYLGNRPTTDLRGKTALLVDDGIATGLTIKAAIDQISQMRPDRVVVAVPVAPRTVVDELLLRADEVIALENADPFRGAIGDYYDEFDAVTDRQVTRLLCQSDARMESPRARRADSTRHAAVH